MPPDCPAKIRGDSTRFRQILCNLIGNAVKFTERGGVRVTAQGQAGPTLRIAVSDTGPGLSEQDRGRLFEPFVRAGRAGRDRLDGTGLGLAIVRHVAQAHGEGVDDLLRLVLLHAGGGQEEHVAHRVLQRVVGESDPVGEVRLEQLSGDRRAETEILKRFALRLGPGLFRGANRGVGLFHALLRQHQIGQLDL
jgi:hypothetical protein